VLCDASVNLLVATDPLLAEAHGAALAAERCLAEARARANAAAFEAGWSASMAMSEAELMGLAVSAQRPPALAAVPVAPQLNHERGSSA